MADAAAVEDAAVLRVHRPPVPPLPPLSRPPRPSPRRHLVSMMSEHERATLLATSMRGDLAVAWPLLFLHNWRAASSMYRF